MKQAVISFICMVSLFTLGCEKEDPSKSCIDPERIRSGLCSYEYFPVCGCDGKTYGNACSADMAGVRSWTEGECN